MPCSMRTGASVWLQRVGGAFSHGPGQVRHRLPGRPVLGSARGCPIMSETGRKGNRMGAQLEPRRGTSHRDVTAATTWKYVMVQHPDDLYSWQIPKEFKVERLREVGQMYHDWSHRRALVYAQALDIMRLYPTEFAREIAEKRYGIPGMQENRHVQDDCLHVHKQWYKVYKRFVGALLDAEVYLHDKLVHRWADCPLLDPPFVWNERRAVPLSGSVLSIVASAQELNPATELKERQAETRYYRAVIATQRARQTLVDTPWSWVPPREVNRLCFVFAAAADRYSSIRETYNPKIEYFGFDLAALSSKDVGKSGQFYHEEEGQEEDELWED